jgi:nucleotide-binding universal stress UspA family protein
MYRVLVPVDRDTTRALHQAKYVARLPAAADAVEATVFHVPRHGGFDTLDEVAFSEVAAAAEAATHLEDAGVTVHRRLAEGIPSVAIADAIEDVDADEVVMAGRKRSGVTDVLLGSTVQDVLLSTTRPVTLTGRQARLGEGVRDLLLPVDRDEERALHQARYVAGLPGEPEDVAATVYYVFPHQDYRGAPPHEFDEVAAAVAAADHLESAGFEVRRVAEGGEVARRIVDVAADGGVDGVVMGGRKRSGVQKVLLGSTVHDVLLSADRPVTITG